MCSPKWGYQMHPSSRWGAEVSTSAQDLRQGPRLGLPPSGPASFRPGLMDPVCMCRGGIHRKARLGQSVARMRGVSWLVQGWFGVGFGMVSGTTAAFQVLPGLISKWRGQTTLIFSGLGSKTPLMFNTRRVPWGLGGREGRGAP